MLLALFVVLAISAVACSRPPKDDPNSAFDGPPLTEPDAIRKFDFAGAESVAAAARFTNSTPDVAAIIFADVTGDGQEEAIVPFSTGGNQGYAMYQVYKINKTQPSLVLTRNADRKSASGIRMTVADGVLTETTGVFANEDPLCCPSQLKQTTFKWDGSKMDVASEKVIANPNAPKS